MTEDELFAEVEALRATGNRGEFDGVEGTPEGTYLWAVTHPASVSPSIPGPSARAIFQITYEISGPDVYVPQSFGAAAVPA